MENNPGSSLENMEAKLAKIVNDMIPAGRC
jgi:hypothetical protein